MPEQGSGKRGTVKPGFRAVFTQDALSANAIETAERSFARWIARGFATRKSEPSTPALRGTSCPQGENADGATDTRLITPSRGGRG